MKILVASVAKQIDAIFLPHLKTIQWQDVEAEISYAVIADDLSDTAKAAVVAAGGEVLEATPKPRDATYEVGPDTHHWTAPTFEWLGAEKDRLIRIAAEEGYDALLLVDSDLLLGPETLRSLVEAEKPVVSAVFWTRWTPGATPLPQVWLRHPYDFEGMGRTGPEFFEALEAKQLQEVVGLGACTLIRSEAFPAVSFMPRLSGLPPGGMADGEDRHFCVRARRNYVTLWADAWPNIFHVYRPEDAAKIPEVLATLEAKRPETPSFGDWVSLTLEPLDEPRLPTHKEYVRGRIGALKLMPQLEEELLRLRPGEEAFVSVDFPLWYPLEDYQGKTRLIRLRLVDVQTHGIILPV